MFQSRWYPLMASILHLTNFRSSLHRLAFFCRNQIRQLTERETRGGEESSGGMMVSDWWKNWRRLDIYIYQNYFRSPFIIFEDQADQSDLWYGDMENIEFFAEGWRWKNGCNSLETASILLSSNISIWAAPPTLIINNEYWYKNCPLSPLKLT